MFASDGKTVGTFKSIDEPVYVSFFMKNQVYAFNRDGKMLAIEVNNSDYLFKVALQQNDLMAVKEILQKGSLCGNAIIAYLKEQGHSEIALFFEKDVQQRFNLALACGNLQVALDTALEMKETDCYAKLATTAMALGNYEIAEACYQKTRAFDKLNFFYAATGSTLKLRKMQGVMENVGDPMLRFDSATLNASAADKVKVLAEAGQVPLAYMTAKAHGVEDFAKTLEQTLVESDEYDHERIFAEAEAMLKRGKGARALLPCRPLVPDSGLS
jgi:coatomer subunit alpha